MFFFIYSDLIVTLRFIMFCTLGHLFSSRASVSLSQYRVVQKYSCMFEFSCSLSAHWPRQPMHSAPALTEHVSLNLARFFCSTLYLATKPHIMWILLMNAVQTIEQHHIYSSLSVMHQRYLHSESEWSSWVGRLAIYAQCPRLTLESNLLRCLFKMKMMFKQVWLVGKLTCQ